MAPIIGSPQTLQVVQCASVWGKLLAIKSWRHRGLQRFYEAGDCRGIIPEHELRLAVRLDALASALVPEDMNVLPGWRFHSWGGRGAGIFSINVSGNWRLTFKFCDGNAFEVNYEDPH